MTITRGCWAIGRDYLLRCPRRPHYRCTEIMRVLSPMALVPGRMASPSCPRTGGSSRTVIGTRALGSSSCSPACHKSRRRQEFVAR